MLYLAAGTACPRYSTVAKKNTVRITAPAVSYDCCLLQTTKSSIWRKKLKAWYGCLLAVCTRSAIFSNSMYCNAKKPLHSPPEQQQSRPACRLVKIHHVSREHKFENKSNSQRQEKATKTPAVRQTLVCPLLTFIGSPIGRLETPVFYNS